MSQSKHKHRQLSKRGVRFIAKFEGFLSCPYQDTGGIWTIGYGHTGGVTSHTPCVSKAEARKLLAKDVNTAEAAVRNYVKVPLNQNQFDALVSFVYNIGPGGFASSTALRVLNQGNYKAVPAALLMWVKDARGNTLAGLVRRRKAEGRRFRRKI